MSDIKTYEPEVIQENPLPIHEEDTFNVSQSTSNDTYSPQTINDQPFPKKLVAQETIASTLNTKSRKILGSYEFTNKGAIQIGKYENGVSGDLKLSPDGIVARDSAGNTTFALDGTTGDAVFKGEIRSGSIMVEGEIRDENGNTIIDAEGLVSATSFVQGTVVDTTQFDTSSQTFNNVTSMTLNIVLTKTANVLIGGVATGRRNSATDSASAFLRLALDGVQVGGVMDISGVLTTDGRHNTSVSPIFIASVGAGTTVLTMQIKRDATGTGDARLVGGADYQKSLFYLILGK